MGMEKKDMSRLKILVAGLICGLIISLAFNVSVAWELMKSQELYRDLSRDYDELRQSYDELKGTSLQLAELNESLVQLRTELDRLTEENRQLEERLRVEGMPGWIMAAKTAYTSDNEIVQVAAIDLLIYHKLDLALQEAEMASLKHLAHPLEMIELTNCEAKAIVEFLSGKQANVTEGMRYGFAVSYNETLYSVSMIFTWIPPVIS